MNKFEEQIIALAGMFQAGYLVREVARAGSTHGEIFEHSINSVLKLDSHSVSDVYDGLAGVKTGIEILASLYSPETKARDMEISQYVLGIAYLERKLMKNGELLNTLKAGIERANAQSETYSSVHENVIANLASTYQDTISTLQPRIVVAGEQTYLSDTANANKIRALLLALMRSAVLWRQLGGRRWHLLFKRSKIMRAAKMLTS